MIGRQLAYRCRPSKPPYNRWSRQATSMPLSSRAPAFASPRLCPTSSSVSAFASRRAIMRWLGTAFASRELTRLCPEPAGFSRFPPPEPHFSPITLSPTKKGQVQMSDIVRIKTHARMSQAVIWSSVTLRGPPRSCASTIPRLCPLAKGLCCLIKCSAAHPRRVCSGLAKL